MPAQLEAHRYALQGADWLALASRDIFGPLADQSVSELDAIIEPTKRRLREIANTNDFTEAGRSRQRRDVQRAAFDRVLSFTQRALARVDDEEKKLPALWTTVPAPAAQSGVTDLDPALTRSVRAQTIELRAREVREAFRRVSEPATRLALAHDAADKGEQWVIAAIDGDPALTIDPILPADSLVEVRERLQRQIEPKPFAIRDALADIRGLLRSNFTAACAAMELRADEFDTTLPDGLAVK